ncbi:MAG TPA: DegV family protein [Nitrospirota bacterium]|nr:DegV family protein [Nitrospirota bacterium]
MSKVAVVTDSSAYIPEELCKKLNISVVPISVIWEGETFFDGITIKPSEFYSRLKDAKTMPTTSQPAPEDMRKSFSHLLEQGYEIMGIFISEKVSGTFASALQAREELAAAKDKIFVFNSENISMALGFQTLAVARAAVAGASFADCQKLAEKVRPDTGVFFAVDTLEFLHRGGRIGNAQWLLGAALNMKPILTIRGGIVDSADRVRTINKALDRIIELVSEKCAGKSNIRLATLHANAEDNAKLVLGNAAAKLNAVESVLSEVSPSIGTHLGPGTVGLAYCTGA